MQKFLKKDNWGRELICLFYLILFSVYQYSAIGIKINGIYVIVTYN